ncbi:hypothetical protein ZEAMMB73_Zm00001d009632, partial [Zea mays]
FIKEDIKEFCLKLAEISRITVLDFANLKLPIFIARPDRVEDGIRRCYQEAKNKPRDQKIDLLLAILLDRNDSLYENIKRTCETDIGLVSQCYFHLVSHGYCSYVIAKFKLLNITCPNQHTL